MKKIKVYTMGGNEMSWREKLANSSPNDIISFIHPPLFKVRVSKNEFDEWKRYAIYSSDIVILNIEKIDNDTAYEVGVINAINSFSNKHIFVVGVGNKIDELPSYIHSAIFHYEKDYEDAIDYISNFAKFN